MRTTFKIIIAIVVIGTGFGAYWWFQPTMHLGLPKIVKVGPAATRPAENQSLLNVQNSDSVWVKQYDNLGRISYQFKADEYLPQGGDNVNVTKPRTVFFLKSGKGRSRLELDGDTGNITVDNAPDAPKDGLMKKESFGHGAMQPPRKGKLHNVVIRLFEDESADPDKVAPTLIMHTNNVAFDNETFRIFTEGYTDQTTGEQIASDWVKVKVEGQYDFVGYGLTVRWNDLDQRLELLKIRHGESLTINDPSLLRGATFGAKHPAAAAAATDDVEAAATGEAVTTAGPPAPVVAAVARPTRSDVVLIEDPPVKAKKGKKDKAATTKHSDAAAPATKSATSKPVKAPQPPYHAVFNEDVVVKQGDQTVAVADVMNVDFLMDSGKRSPTTAPSTHPSTAPTTQGTTSRPATAPAPVLEHVVPMTTTTAPSEAATTKPAVATTKPSDAEKITVYWHGPLIITPASAPAELSLAPGETVLQFIGKPAVLTRDGSEVKCAVATYRSGDGKMDLHNSEQFPKVLIRQLAKDVKSPDAPPATISTDWAEYSLLTKVATLHGASEAHIPIPPQSGDGATTQPTDIASAGGETMEARWTDWAAFHLSGDSESQMSIEHADFAGDVDIRHPQMKLKSQHLELAFDPSGAIRTPAESTSSSSGANLKRAVATESVWCELADAKGKKQTIICDRLDLKTAVSDDGRMYPEIVDATGKVKATDDTQELSAGHVVLTLAPTTRPDQAAALAADAVADADNRAVVPTSSESLLGGSGGVELRTMVATEAVSVRSADGATAVGDSLNVSAEPGAAGKTTVVLVGAPARVVDASENVITGPKIIVHPKESIATIEGAGTMDATQNAASGKTATTRPAGDAKASRPLHVTWTDGAIVNGPTNRIEASGKVTASTPDPDGTINTARGERVVVVMVDKLLPGAATQPDGTTKPVLAEAKPTTATTKPAETAGGGQFKMDLFKDKEVGSVVLLDKNRAVINSNLTGADGALLRETQLQATSMRFQPRDGQMLIPVPGEMIVRDHRPAEEKPAASKTPPANGAQDNTSSGRGDTAFKWSKSLAYDQTKRRAVMAGDVLIVHKPEAQKQPATQPAKAGPQANPVDPVRVNADWVAADFESADAAAKPATDNAAEPSAMHLKALTAIGNITITRSTGQMLAQKITFNPQTGWIVATGTANNPASYTDLVTGQTTTALEIWWNSNTWDVRFKNITARAGK